MKTEHSHKCQKSLRSDNSVPIQSVLRTHTPDTSLERSTSQIRFTLCTLCSSSAESPFLSIANSAHRAICPTLCIAVTRLDCPLPAECCLYMPLMCISNIRLCHRYSSGSVWHSFSFSRSYWHTSSLDVRVFARRHTARRCCPLLYCSLLKATCPE